MILWDILLESTLYLLFKKMSTVPGGRVENLRIPSNVLGHGKIMGELRNEKSIF
jgi:hypothetical protein